MTTMRINKLLIRFSLSLSHFLLDFVDDDNKIFVLLHFGNNNNKNEKKNSRFFYFTRLR